MLRTLVHIAPGIYIFPKIKGNEQNEIILLKHFEITITQIAIIGEHFSSAISVKRKTKICENILFHKSTKMFINIKVNKNVHENQTSLEIAIYDLSLNGDG